MYGDSGMGGYGALSGLASAGQNAMSQFGAARQVGLANQAIAMGNAFGQLGNSYYNAMGASNWNNNNPYGSGGGFNVNGPGGQVAYGAYSQQGGQPRSINLGDSFGGGGGGGNSDAMQYAKMMGDHFRSYRNAAMDQSPLHALNAQLETAYGLMTGIPNSIYRPDDPRWTYNYQGW